MKKINLLRGVLALLILLLPLATVSQVYAAKPVFSEFSFDWTEPLDYNQCEFEIIKHFWGRLQTTSYFDNDGTLTRIHDTYGQTYQTWSANGKQLDVNLKGPIHYEILPNSQFITSLLGTAVFITVPGYGNVWGSAGQSVILWELDDEGNWIFIEEIKAVGNFNPEDWAPICDYLSG